ncbi:leucine-rich repeat serine/threonine-protein kinase 2-like isoform X2 [Bolinopsis microptera]
MLPKLRQLFEEDKEKLLPMIEKGLNFASSYGQLKTVELLITEGARQLAENVSHAAMNGHLLTASYLMMCAQCLALESTAVQNLTLEGRIKEYGVDVDGAFAGDNILSDGPTELFFDKSFDLKVPIKLILEGKGRSNGTDEDTEDCIYHLLLTKHDFDHFSLNWDDLGLPYIADSWLRSLSAMHVVELDLSYNDIGPTLPDSITAMRDLQKFSCNSNALRELPHGLLEMPNLCYVNASSNSLERLFVRGNISQSLKNLNLSKNLLTNLPEQFRDSSIQTLKLSNNQFDSFPGCICGITCMLHLEIDNCKFTDIPNELGRLEELQHLELPRISRLDNIHHELPKTGKILAYLKEKLYSLKPLYEMKLIVVGREGQGKTTLIKRLQKEYTSNKNISTVGIQISKTRLQGSEGTRKPFGVGGRTLVFHTWDFGGQQEYYATHQCFITPATLYILVFSLSSGVSATEELRVWLGNISARAAGSSVLIVGTYLDKVSEAECRTLLKEVSEKIQRWGFGNETNVLIPVITAVSCEPENEFRKTVEKLAESIVREAEKVRYKKKLVLGQLVPNSYLALIEEINKLKNTYEREHKIRTVVQEEELWEIIRKNPACDDIDSEYQFNAVTDLMHNLGIILHFKEPSLQNQYFLDPCWLCSMMGQIVTIREKNPYITSGILKQHKIRHMLKDKRFPETMFPQYLRILNRFEIALKIDADQILIPSLLPQEEDVTYSIPSDLEYFERQISFKNLPSGFIPRILVSTLSYILSVSNELCSPQFDRERQFSGESIFESDGVGKAALTRKRSNAMSQSSRHTTISSDRFSEYSFGSQTSGTSGTSDQDCRLEVEYSSDLAPTLQDMTPVPDHDIFSKVEAARNLMELSLDMDDILIDDDVNGLNNDKEELKLEENPARYELLTDHYLKIWRRGLSFSHP